MKVAVPLLNSVLQVNRVGGRAGFRFVRIPISGLLRPRSLVVCGGLAAATFLAFCSGLAIGDFPLSLNNVVAALLGTGDPGALFVVRELRLPRALVGLLAGLAFGVAGAIYQTTTRNPLASPDMIGISQGAAVAVVAGIVFDLGVGTQVLGVAGAIGAALLIYLLAWKGNATGYRIVLVGVGIAWMCASLTDFLLVQAQLTDAQQALGWLVGNLNVRSWSQVTPLALALLVLVPIALLLSRGMRVLQLGDDVASGLGTPIRSLRVALLVAGAAMVAFATAAAGPIAFVALTAPQIAQRLVRLPWPPLVASGLTGALVVLTADLLARTLVTDIQLPVGVVTGIFGAPVLLWLLLKSDGERSQL